MSSAPARRRFHIEENSRSGSAELRTVASNSIGDDVSPDTVFNHRPTRRGPRDPARPAVGKHSLFDRKLRRPGCDARRDRALVAAVPRIRYGTRERVMFDIFLFTGLRRGDAARLGKQHVQKGIIGIDTEKTGTRVVIPMLPELVRTLKAGPIGDLAYIVTVDGKPTSKEVVGKLFRLACRKAGDSEIGARPAQSSGDACGKSRRNGRTTRSDLRVGRRADGLALHQVGRPQSSRSVGDEQAVAE